VTDPWALGAVLAVLGMAGTLLTLWLLSVLTMLLKRIFPYTPEREQ
jgi:hypothetical protein